MPRRGSAGSFQWRRSNRRARLRRTRHPRTHLSPGSGRCPDRRRGAGHAAPVEIFVPYRKKFLDPFSFCAKEYRNQYALEDLMELYFSPLACSMATRIALYEAGAAAADASFIRVDLKAKRTADGADFLAVNPMGQVPVLRTDEGELLMENPAVLQYVADRFPAAALAPAGGTERYRL